MNSVRNSDIPNKVRITNIDPSKLHMNVAGLLGVPADGKTHERELHKFRPEHREKVWTGLQASQATGLLKVEVVQDGEPAAPAAPPEPAKDEHRFPDTRPPGDDFSKIGVSEMLGKRLYSVGINTFLKFAETDEKVLLHIEGITPANLPGFSEKALEIVTERDLAARL